jgi:hypothetical protein
MTGKRGSKTPQRVSELDTPWLSAWPPRPLKTSPSVVADARTLYRPAAAPRIPTALGALFVFSSAKSGLTERVDRKLAEKSTENGRRKRSTETVDGSEPGVTTE